MYGRVLPIEHSPDSSHGSLAVCSDRLILLRQSVLGHAAEHWPESQAAAKLSSSGSARRACRRFAIITAACNELL